MKYELMVILNPKQTDKEIEKHLSEVKDTILENKFELTDEDIWGVRELSYRMKGLDKGYYVVLNFVGESENVQELHKDLNLQTFIVRHLLTKVPDSYVLMRYEQLGTTKAGKLSSPAEELNKKVRRSSKKKTDEAAPKQESSKEDTENLDEKLKAIIEDKDIDL